MPPHETDRGAQRNSPSPLTVDASSVVGGDDMQTVSSVSERETGGKPALRDASLSQPEMIPDCERNGQPLKEKFQESPIDPAYSPKARTFKSMKHEPTKVARRRTSRRPSESFFDISSSEDEDEGSASELPILEKASCLTISRVSNANQVLGSHQPEPLIDENIDSTHHCFLNDSISKQQTDSLMSTNAAKDALYDDDSICQTGVTSRDRSGRADDVLFKDTPDISARSVQLSSRKVSHGSFTDQQHAETSPNAVKVTKNGLKRSKSDSTLNLGRRKVVIKLEPLSTSHNVRRRSSDHCFVTTPFPYDGINKVSTGDESSSTRLEASRMENKRETLFINIGLAHHPYISMSVEITSDDKTPFDDEALFRQVRSAYHKRLLGWSRIGFRLVRDISHVTLITPEVNYDGNRQARVSSFLKHFHDPSLGRKRKTWIVWLRRHNQPPHKSNPIPPSITESFHPRHPASIIESVKMRVSEGSGTIRSPLAHTVLNSLAMNRIPDKQSVNRKTGGGHPMIETGRKTCARSSFDVSEEECTDFTTMRVEFHHTFNFWMIAFLSICTIWLSISATILWVLFGGPVTNSEGQRTARAQPLLLTGTSRRKSPATVLTGLVLGLMVLIIGVLLELCLIAGGWILL